MKKSKTLKLIIAGAIITCTILTVTGCGKKTNEVTEYNKENDVSINQNTNEQKNSTNVESKNVGSTNTSKDNNKDDKTKIEILSKDEAKKLGKENYDKILKLYWEFDQYLTADGTKYKLPDSYINQIKNLCTDKEYQKFSKERGIYEKSGEFYINSEIGSNPRYISETFDVSDISANKIVYSIVAKYDDDECKTKNYNFILIKENNNWKVDEFTSPY